MTILTRILACFAALSLLAPLASGGHNASHDSITIHHDPPPFAAQGRNLALAGLVESPCMNLVTPEWMTFCEDPTVRLHYVVHDEDGERTVRTVREVELHLSQTASPFAFVVPAGDVSGTSFTYWFTAVQRECAYHGLWFGHPSCVWRTGSTEEFRLDVERLPVSP